MSLQSRIQDWLGITYLHVTQVSLHNDLEESITQLHAEIGKLRLQVGAVTPGLGRVIAKLDPIFAGDELDPVRKAESDAIGQRVIDRLKAEYAARRHTEGKS